MADPSEIAFELWIERVMHTRWEHVLTPQMRSGTGSGAHRLVRLRSHIGGMIRAVRGRSSHCLPGLLAGLPPADAHPTGSICEAVVNSEASPGVTTDRSYVPGRIHRSDRMASDGLYEDGKKGIR